MQNSFSIFSVLPSIFALVGAIIGTFIGARISLQNEKRKIQSDYLKNKIARLESVLEEIIGVNFEKRDRITSKNFVENYVISISERYSQALKSFDKVSHYLSNEFQEKNRECVAKTARALSQGMAEALVPKNLKNETGHKISSQEREIIIDEIEKIIENIKNEIQKELLESNQQIQELF